MNTVAAREKIVSEIDRYYFTELLGELHPSLQFVARDKRLLCLSAEAELIQTLSGLFSEGYLLAAWHCADILSVSDDTLVTISQAHAAMMLAYLILDVQVDYQLPKSMRLAPLVCIHFIQSGKHKLAECLPPESAFWDDFDTYLSTLFNGLTAESASLDGHDPIYTEEVMRAVCHEKSAQVRLAARALSAVVNNPAGGDLCEVLIDTMCFGDQLLDDLLDWKSDFEDGRITYPLQQLMEQSGLTVQAVEAMTVEDLQPLMEKTRLDLAVLDKAAAIYESGRERLREAGYADSRWDAIMAGRIDHVEKVRRRMNVKQFVETLAARL